MKLVDEKAKLRDSVTSDSIPKRTSINLDSLKTKSLNSIPDPSILIETLKIGENILKIDTISQKETNQKDKIPKR